MNPFRKLWAAIIANARSGVEQDIKLYGKRNLPMTKTTFEVHPQRSDGRAYIDCETPIATSFAVVRIEKFSRNSRTYTVKRVINRHSIHSQASSEATSQTARYAPVPRSYKLGKPMGKKSG